MNKLLMILLAGIICFMPNLARTQDTEREFTEAETREELEETIKIEKIDRGFLYDYGAWLRGSTYLFDQADDSHTFRTVDGRFWFKCMMEKNHEFYIRVKTMAVDYNQGDSFDGDDSYRINPRLDQGFYKVSLLDVLYDEEMAKLIYPKITLQMGRQFLSLGSGLVYNRVDDGLKADLKCASFNSTLLYARTVKSANDIDRSRPDATHSNRLFAGAQVETNLLDRHRPYVFALFQRDKNQEKPENTLQEYDYHSNYYGLGANGSVIPRLQYTAEYIRETGTSHASLSNVAIENIKASAMLLQLRYLPKVDYDPIFTLRYASGSGDKNRGSVTNTLGGNRAGTPDTNFLYFGYILTGYALEPKISNLTVTNLAVSVKPIKDKEYWEDTEVGLAYYQFAKNKKEGAVSDGRAILSKKDVGSEFDLYYNWKILSDLTFSFKTGFFTPGSAYPSTADDGTKFYNLGVTYSF